MVNGLQSDALQEERARWILDLAASARKPKRKSKSGSSQLDFGGRPFRILMRLMKAKGEKKEFTFPADASSMLAS